MSDALSEVRNVVDQKPPFLSIVSYVFIKYLARIAFFLYFRTYVRNAKALPKTGPVIFSPIHRSNLDVPIVGSNIRRKLHYLGKGSLMANRFSAWVLRGCGCIPLDRDSRADKLALDASLKALKEGKTLAVFPEGERKSGPEVFPMLDGAVWLSAKANAPILPVGIGGSERAMPKGKYIPKPRKVVILYGDLIPAPQPQEGAKRVARSEIRKYSEELRVILQELFDEAQEIAGSPNKKL
ncbi:MAG TPA: lysophospholipid acyltransferase family protein [Acidimicrobiales bacterium]|jgi:1-acyl-sn-glycerol-3-phosphate acyltransferase|nr:lysophospholipid acyltransferase family protein [Acidimicrobiales bacterium]|tara:strand:+ start:5647 stop:6363 length:717 start_codon:yes stop_codon:yes gene_type:complete